MAHSRRLEWTQANRTKRNRIQRLATGLRNVVDRAASASAPSSDEVISTVAGCVDDEFKKHCCLFVTARGKLIVSVDDPSLVYPVRQRWLGPLRRVLFGLKCRPTVNWIAFEFGTEGTELGEFEEGRANEPRQH